MRAAQALLGAVLLAAGGAQAAPISGQGSWESTLKARDLAGNAVALSSASAVFFYDTLLDVTWYTRGFNVERQNAAALVDGLTLGGYTDWRQPMIRAANPSPSPGSVDGVSSDYGYAPADTGWGTRSEMGHLYYVTLGNDPWCTAVSGFDNFSCTGSYASFAARSELNTGSFAALTFSWLSNPYAGNWAFDFPIGYQTYSGYSGLAGSFTMALRDGDVLREIDDPATEVPLPGTLLLGLGGLLLLARQRRLPS